MTGITIERPKRKEAIFGSTTPLEEKEKRQRLIDKLIAKKARAAALKNLKKKKAARKKNKTKRRFKPGSTPMAKERLRTVALEKAGLPGEIPPILPPSEEEW
jgi:hypothetical protein